MSDTGHGHDSPGHHHRDVSGGRERAAVFGVSDGLVSNVSLILGVAGADPAPDFVRLAGLAGLVAGAASMAAGEYISVRAQSELFERELALERVAHRRDPGKEIDELTKIYESRGISPETAREVASDVMRDPEVALATHAREELGMDPGAVGRPVAAASWSFLSFSVGALVPLVPWLITSGGVAVVASITAAAVAALAVGLVLARLTERPPARVALRQLLFAAVPASVTWTIGSIIGVSSGG
ncbi:MAG TPA: VIT1/CCC1 transporter family protein [Acidimicrobiales bacterium]|jgi:VIT1/CCC1 family predicted Fe2+/Mn2+ transporter